MRITAPDGRVFYHDATNCPFPQLGNPNDLMLHEVTMNERGDITAMPVCMMEIDE